MRKTKPGIELTERPPRVTAYERALKIEVPEDVVLPYEWPQESDHYWRTFRVPATLLTGQIAAMTAMHVQLAVHRLYVSPSK
jgi:hypothetical protein